MADENIKIVDVLFGPYRDQRLQMSPAEAALAIADGWVRDPDAPPPDPNEPPPTLTEEQTAERVEKARAWAQGQWEQQAQGGAQIEPESTRSMSADEPGKYTTRHATPSRPKRGS